MTGEGDSNISLQIAANSVLSALGNWSDNPKGFFQRFRTAAKICFWNKDVASVWLQTRLPSRLTDFILQNQSECLTAEELISLVEHEVTDSNDERFKYGQQWLTRQLMDSESVVHLHNDLRAIYQRINPKAPAEELKESVHLRILLALPKTIQQRLRYERGLDTKQWLNKIEDAVHSYRMNTGSPIVTSNLPAICAVQPEQPMIHPNVTRPISPPALDQQTLTNALTQALKEVELTRKPNQEQKAQVPRNRNRRPAQSNRNPSFGNKYYHNEGAYHGNNYEPAYNHQYVEGYMPQFRQPQPVPYSHHNPQPIPPSTIHQGANRVITETQNLHQGYQEGPLHALATITCTAGESFPRGNLKTCAGTLNSRPVTVLLDSGSDSVFVAKHLLDPTSLTGGTIPVRTSNGLYPGCPIAKATFQCPYYPGGTNRVVVLEDPPFDVLLGEVPGTIHFSANLPPTLRPQPVTGEMGNSFTTKHTPEGVTDGITGRTQQPRRQDERRSSTKHLQGSLHSRPALRHTTSLPDLFTHGRFIKTSTTENWRYPSHLPPPGRSAATDRGAYTCPQRRFWSYSDTQAFQSNSKRRQRQSNKFGSSLVAPSYHIGDSLLPWGNFRR